MAGGDGPSSDDLGAYQSQPEVLGFVYLMKSGRYYKIGRSVCAEKRAYEVQLVLPEELSADDIGAFRRRRFM
jgi:hypothetical protein